MLQKKICMLGSFSVGKTSLVKRFVESIFSERYLTTVGVKIDKRVVTAGSGELTLMLWDLYGEDEYQKIRMSYLRGASGYLLVADGTRPATLDKALAIQEEAEKNFGPTPYVVALNKCDLTAEWGVPAEREAEIGKRARGAVVRTSARTGEGVELAFDSLAKAMIAT
ncbi:MAG: Rab family GTPase [Candidatus Acidiferrales bacterium]